MVFAIELSDIHFSYFDMGQIFSKHSKNNLDLNSNDAKDCASTTCGEETEFIQTGVEIPTQKIVDWLELLIWIMVLNMKGSH